MSLTILLSFGGFLVNFTSTEETFHCWLWSDTSNAFLLQNWEQWLRKQTNKQGNKQLGASCAYCLFPCFCLFDPGSVDLSFKVYKWNITKRKRYPQVAATTQYSTIYGINSYCKDYDFEHCSNPNWYVCFPFYCVTYWELGKIHVFQHTMIDSSI